MNKSLLFYVFVTFALIGCATTRIADSNTASNTTPNETHGFSEMPPLTLAPIEEIAVPTIEPIPVPTPSPLRLRINQEFRAPYDGVFFSDIQSSYMVAELESFQRRVGLVIENMRSLFQVRLNYETELLRVQINGDRLRFRSIIESRNDEISRLLRQNETFANRNQNFPWEAVLSGAGGLLLGVIGGFLLGFISGI